MATFLKLNLDTAFLDYYLWKNQKHPYSFIARCIVRESMLYLTLILTWMRSYLARTSHCLQRPLLCSSANYDDIWLLLNVHAFNNLLNFVRMRMAAKQFVPFFTSWKIRLAFSNSKIGNPTRNPTKPQKKLV